MLCDMDKPGDKRRLVKAIEATLGLNGAIYLPAIEYSINGQLYVVGLCRGMICWFTQEDGRRQVAIVPSAGRDR